MIADQFCNILNGEVTLFQKASGLLKSDFLNDRSNSSTVFVKQFAEIRPTDMEIFCNFSDKLSNAISPHFYYTARLKILNNLFCNILYFVNTVNITRRNIIIRIPVN